MCNEVKNLRKLMTNKITYIHFSLSLILPIYSYFYINSLSSNAYTLVYWTLLTIIIILSYKLSIQKKPYKIILKQKHMNNKTTFFGLCTGAALVLFLCICWLNAYGAHSALWSQTICFSGLTWYALSKASRRNLSLALTSLALIIGRLLPVLPIHITNVKGSFGYLIIDLISIASILLATICFHEKRSYTFRLSAIILILLNTSVYSEWVRLLS